MATKKRKRKNHTYRIRKAYNLINKLVKKHGRVRVVFQTWCRFNKSFLNDFRRRVISSDGKCKVAYMTNGYKKYSGYSTSCFYDSSEKKDLKTILREMKKHDQDDFIPIEVQYGWFFTKKEKI